MCGIAGVVARGAKKPTAPILEEMIALVRHPFFSHLPRWELTAKVKGFLSQEVRGATEGSSAYEALEATVPAAFANWQHFCQAQYLEATGLLPGYILSSQGDRMAMAHSVEGRFPFLDHRVMEFSARLPNKLKMNVLDEKYLLKQAGRRLIPKSVRDRPKQPYRAPDAKSFVGEGSGPRQEFVRELLAPKRIAEDGIFNPKAVDILIRKCERGAAIGVKDNMALVSILSTQLLVDQFVRNFGRRADHGRA